MYGRMDLTTKRLVAAILQDADPREETDTPEPDKRLAAQKAVYEQMAFDFDTAQAEAETPETTMDSFMRKMAMSESSGDTNAEITLDDGRTFTGLY